MPEEVKSSDGVTENTPGTGLTVKVSVVLRVIPPPVAVTLIVLVPRGVVEEVVMFRVLEQVELHEVVGE